MIFNAITVIEACERNKIYKNCNYTVDIRNIRRFVRNGEIRYVCFVHDDDFFLPAFFDMKYNCLVESRQLNENVSIEIKEFLLVEVTSYCRGKNVAVHLGDIRIIK